MVSARPYTSMHLVNETNADSRTTRTGRPCTPWHLKHWKASSTRHTSAYPQYAKSSHRIHGQRCIKQRNPRRTMVKLPGTGSRGWQNQRNATRKSPRSAVPVKWRRHRVFRFMYREKIKQCFTTDYNILPYTTTHYLHYRIMRLMSDRLTASILPDVFVNCGTFDSSPTHPCIISHLRVLFLLSPDLSQIQAQLALHIKCLAPVCHL